MAWMIYGANGYTGRLCAERAVAVGEHPILAGRRVSAVAPIADGLGLPHRAFGLDDADDLVRALEGVDTVLHCAGPYEDTARPMAEACLRAGVNYLDITGEIAVFEHLLGRSPEFRRVGICAIPGVGFDVVPTDAVAARLVEALPSARRLELAFATLGGGTSAGTLKTTVRSLPRGGAARIGGRIVSVPTAWRVRTAPLGGKDRTVVSIPWGDVSTAYHSTGIPDITVYMGFPDKAVAWLGRLDPVRGWLGARPLQAAIAAYIDRAVDGPSAEAREAAASFVWGRVEDDEGRWAELTLSAPEGYGFTAHSAVEAARRVEAGEVAPGAWTPSRAFGSDFVSTVDGVAIDAVRTGSGTARGAIA